MMDFAVFAERLDRKLEGAADISAALLEEEGAVRQFIANGGHVRALNNLLSRTQTQVFAGSVINANRCVLRKSAWSLWSISKIASRSDLLHFQPVAAIRCFPDASTLLASRWTLPYGFELDRFSRSVILDAEEADHACPEGTSMTQDGKTQVLDIWSPTEDQGILVSVETKPMAGLMWTFDRQSGVAKSFNSVNGIDSGIETIIDLLGTVKSPKSVSVLDRYCRHDMHFIRWKAMIALAKVAPNKADAVFGRGQQDAHPEIRAASTLARERMAMMVGER